MTSRWCYVAEAGIDDVWFVIAYTNSDPDALSGAVVRTLKLRTGYVRCETREEAVRLWREHDAPDEPTTVYATARLTEIEQHRG